VSATFKHLREMLHKTMQQKSEALANFTTAYFGKEHLLDTHWDYIFRQNNWGDATSDTLRNMLTNLTDILPSHTLIDPDDLLKDCDYITDMVRLHCLSMSEFSYNLDRLTVALNSMNADSTAVLNYRNPLRRADKAMTL
jgi:hypothetical protein